MSRVTDKSQSEDDVALEGETDDLGDNEPDELTIALNREIAECFAIFDKNKTRTMEFKHVNKALQSLGVNLSTLDLLESKDTLENQEGIVEFEPFRAFAFDKLIRIDEIDSLTAAFKVFDPDNDGSLPPNRLKKWMTTLGDPLTEKEAKELVKLGDPSGKGYIFYDDLVGKLCAPL